MSSCWMRIKKNRNNYKNRFLYQKAINFGSWQKKSGVRCMLRYFYQFITITKICNWRALSHICTLLVRHQFINICFAYMCISANNEPWAWNGHIRWDKNDKKWIFSQSSVSTLLIGLSTTSAWNFLILNVFIYVFLVKILYFVAQLFSVVIFFCGNGVYFQFNFFFLCVYSFIGNVDVSLVASICICLS